jgi:hypothetical protein
MATAVSATFDFTLNASHTESNPLNPSGLKAAVINFAKALSWASGTGAAQVDRLFSGQRTLTTGANENLDLAGTLTDAFGATITMARIKLIWIYAATANTTNLQFNRPASNGVPGPLVAASDAIELKPGAGFLWFDPGAVGYAVTAGTGDLFNVVNAAGASATYDVVILGCSA